MTTPKLQMPELVVGQAGKELTHNQALAVLDQLAQAVVVDKDLTAPPGSPANGAMYIVAASATGAWAGQSGKLAYWLTTVAAWTFITPADGWLVWVADEAARYERKAGSWVVLAGGSASDLLSTLTSAEVSITGATTLSASAFGKMHVCSGASAAYTVGLPATAGNAGKVIGFRMSPALTKLVTLDANMSELIDGETIRVMWANETAILLCNGSAWVKIAGKSIPMACEMYPSSALSVASSVNTKVPLSVTNKDNTGAMASTSTGAIISARSGTYLVQAITYYQPGTTTMSINQCRVHVNGTLAPLGANSQTLDVPPADGYFNAHQCAISVSAGSKVELYAYHESSSSAARSLYVNSTEFTYIAALEILTW